MPTPRRLTSPIALAAACVAALMLVMLLPASAEAASWQTVNRTHGAKLQACTDPAGSGKLRVRVRIDNRDASHVHLGGISAPDGRSRNLRARPGQLTNAASLVVGRYTRISIGIGETNGQGSGDLLPASTFRRC